MTAHKGQGSVYRRKGSPYWWISFSHRGTKHRESSESERESVARKLLRKRLGEIDAGTFAPGKQTVAEILALVITDYEANGRASIDRCKLAVKHLTIAGHPAGAGRRLCSA